jgi:type I restriction enzyme M protein
MSINTTVKAIQDIMRKDAGVDGDAQRLNQLGWMLFFKIFSDSEEELELMQDDYRSPIPDRLRWKNWAADAEGMTGDELLEFVNNDLFKTLKNLSLDGDQTGRGAVVRGVFEDAINYMKSGHLMRQVINKVNEVDFNNSKDRHLFGDIYEQILRDLQAAGNAGEFYTPRAVTQFMVEMVDPRLDEHVFDPACGTGGFLTGALEHMRQQERTKEDREKWQKNIVGIEKKALPHLLCVTNMMLHGVEVPTNVQHRNTLARSLANYTSQDRVDVIMTNPPFGGIEEDGVEKGFGSYKTKETADLFLVLIMHLLRDGGRAAIVLPDGTLFGEGVKTRIKEKLLTECDLHTIVRLPNGVFNPYTGIKTNLLFFTKGKPTKEVWYYEHPYPLGSKSYSKTKPIRLEEFQPERDWWTNREETPQAWRVSIDEIRAANFNLDIKNPHQSDEEESDVEALIARHIEIEEAVSRTRERLKGELEAALFATSTAQGIS